MFIPNYLFIWISIVISWLHLRQRWREGTERRRKKKNESNEEKHWLQLCCCRVQSMRSAWLAKITLQMPTFNLGERDREKEYSIMSASNERESAVYRTLNDGSLWNINSNNIATCCTVSPLAGIRKRTVLDFSSKLDAVICALVYLIDWKIRRKKIILWASYHFVSFFLNIIYIWEKCRSERICWFFVVRNNDDSQEREWVHIMELDIVHSVLFASHMIFGCRLHAI